MMKWNYEDKDYLMAKESAKKAYIDYLSLIEKIAEKNRKFMESFCPIGKIEYRNPHTYEIEFLKVYSKEDEAKIAILFKENEEYNNSDILYQQYQDLIKSMKEIFFKVNPEAQYACDFIKSLVNYCAFPPEEELVDGFKSEKIIWIEENILPKIIEELDYNGIQRACNI